MCSFWHTKYEVLTACMSSLHLNFSKPAKFKRWKNEHKKCKHLKAAKTDEASGKGQLGHSSCLFPSSSHLREI